MRIPLFLFFLLFASISSAQIVVAVQRPGQGYEFVNKQTQSPVNNIIWDEAEPFVNGFSRVLLHDHFSFVGNNGKPITEAQFNGARNFSNKLAAVKNENGWGFIDETGKTVIPFQYDIVFDFKEIVTAVYKNKKWSLINAKGELVKELNISVFYGFNKGFAKIEKDGRQGTINTRGDIVFNNTINTQSKKIRIPYSRNVPGNSSACPDNIDFEYGSFLNWKCFTGRVDSVGNTNVITVGPSAPINNRHTIYNRTIPSPLDAYGLFPTNPPDGSNFAVRLGNTNIGAQAERIQYPIHVPLNDTNFSIKYDYAVVFEDPGHTTWTQPRFTVRLFDSAANTYVDCASFEYISTSNLPGFARSTVDTGVVYKPWSSVFVSLRGYAGKTMFLEFTTADCVRRGHWGYAYVDVEKPCGQSVQVQYECTAPNITTLTGPPGFQFYNWWNSTFTTLMGSGQNVVFNPGPPANSTIWLEMIPFNDFGCRDTIPVKITGVFNANFTLSDTNAVCAPHTFTFYNSNIPAASATWNFGDGGTAVGDTVTHTYLTAGTFNVKLDVILPSGCVGTIQKTVTIREPVGSFYFNGASFCNSSLVQFNAVVSDADSLFWNFGDGIILPTVQTTVSHTYALPGVYMPYLTVQSAFGCHNTLPGPDTIRIEKLRAGFYFTEERSCGSTVINFTDTSYAYFGLSSYQWNFGDGSTGSGPDVSHSYSTTGTYNVQLIITGISGCTDTITKPVHATVNSKPVVSITGVNNLCQSATVTFNSNIISADAINLYQWTSSNGNNGAGSTFTVSFNQPGNYTIQLIVSTINGCRDTATHSIHINAAPDVLQPRDQLLCEGNTTADIHFTSSVNGTNFTWVNNNPSIGLAANGTGDIPAFDVINNSALPVIATITVTPTSTGCPGIPTTFTITVNPTTDVAQPSNQSLCDGNTTAAVNFTSSVNNTTYNWTNSNPSIGLAAFGNGSIPSFTAINNGTAPVTATITVRPTSNGCQGPVRTFTITVNPVPTVADIRDQALCNGNTTTAISFTGIVPTAVYNWTNNNPSIGLAANGTGDIAAFTAINNTQAPVTATILVSPTAFGCPGLPVTFTITVSPVVNIAQPVDQDLCHGSSTTAINFPTLVNNVIYSWTNTNPSIGLAANGTGDIPSFIATNNGPTPATATITISPAANGCTGPSKTFTITVNPVPTVLDIRDQSLCNGSTTTAINFTGNVPATAYNWTNTNPLIGLAASGTGDIPAFVVTNNGATPITATINISPTAYGCPGLPATFTITVSPTANVPQPADQSLCNGSTTTAINFSGAVINTTYNWTNTDPSIGLAATGSGDIPSFIATNNGQAPLTATITISAAANGCTGPSKTFTITVNPVPTVVRPDNQALCNGNTTADISFTGTLTAATYNWTNSNSSIGLAANGTGDIAAFTAVNNSTAPVTATINVEPTAFGCPGTAQSFIIIVNPTTDVTQPADQELCKNAPTTPIVFSGSVNGTIYNWSNNNTLIGLAANGTGDIPSFTAINNTTQPVTATITVTANANGCASPVKIFTITVNPVPTITQPADIVLCNGSNTSTIYFATAISGATFSWTNDDPSIGLVGSGNGDIQPFTAINNTNTPVTATITVTASGNGCTGTPKTFTITVNPTASVLQPANQAVCNGSLISVPAFGSAVNGATFSWTNDDPSIGLSANGNGDIPDFTAINNSSVPVTATITVTASGNGCTGTPKTFTITVNPTASVLQPANQAVCNGNVTTQVNFTGSVAGTTYSWTNSNTSIGLTASGNGSVPSFTAINGPNAPVTATITVSPLANGCPGPSKMFVITVNPTATISQPASQLLCNNSNTTPVIFSGSVNGTIYNWTNNNPSIGLAASGSGNITSFTAINTGNTNSIATITVTGTANNCPGAGKTFTILVKPSPNVIQPANQALCNGAATNAIIFSSTVTGSIYSWTNNTPSIGLAASGAGNIASFNAMNTSDSTVTALISIRASANGCIGVPKNASIAVNPTPNVAADNDMNVCRGTTVHLLASGAAQYSWSPSTGLSCSTCANPVTTPVDSIRYVLQGTSGAGCIGYDSILLRVIDPFQMRVRPGDTLCVGESAHLQAMDAHTYTWSPSAGLNDVHSSSPTATPQVSTLYQVIGYDAYNCFKDTGFVQINVGPRPTVNIGTDINTTTGTVLTLHSNTTNGPIISYVWTPATGLSCTDCANPVTTATNNAEYTVTVTNAYGCKATDNMRVTVFCVDGQVFIPNAFTPDGDGLNDVLMIRGKGIAVKTFRIFNRWGEVVFEKKDFNPNDPKFGWDGKVRGVPASPDVFVYTAEVVCDNGIIYTYKGNTTILK